MADILDRITEVGVVQVQPGDVIVLKSPLRLSPDMVREIRDSAAKVWPDNTIIVLDSLDIEVQRPTDG